MPEVVNELDEAIATLKGNPGYTAYAIFNQDGIVLKVRPSERLPGRRAVVSRCSRGGPRR